MILCLADSVYFLFSVTNMCLVCLVFFVYCLLFILFLFFVLISFFPSVFLFLFLSFIHSILNSLESLVLFSFYIFSFYFFSFYLFSSSGRCTTLRSHFAIGRPPCPFWDHHWCCSIWHRGPQFRLCVKEQNSISQ
jgi:hypothetical protein